MSSHLLLSSVIWGDQETKLKPRCGLSHRSGVDSGFLFIQCLQFHWPPMEMLQATFPATRSKPISIHLLELLSDLKVQAFPPCAASQPPGQIERESRQMRETGTRRKQSLSGGSSPGSKYACPSQPSPRPPCPAPNDQFSTHQVLRGRTEHWLSE